MKSEDIFKGIFGLAVRLLGLVFLYFGISAVQPLLDWGALETASKSDVITAILPILFNLAVGWWLIGGGLLIRRAYPETSGFSRYAQRRGQSAAPVNKLDPSQGPVGMDAAERKLEPLVEKPKENRTA